jgi:hypothetical protein
VASGATLCMFFPQDNEPPSSNYATLDTRNGHPVLDFDSGATPEVAIFTGVLPRHYATSGTVGWLVSFERIGDGSQDIDSDGFASEKTVTAATVPGTSGHVDITNVAFTDGAEIDSIAVGEAFRIKIRRDTAVDTAASDANLVAVEIKET